MTDLEPGVNCGLLCHECDNECIPVENPATLHVVEVNGHQTYRVLCFACNSIDDDDESCVVCGEDGSGTVDGIWFCDDHVSAGGRR